MKKYFWKILWAVILIVITIICTKTMLSAFDLKSTDSLIKLKVLKITEVTNESVDIPNSDEKIEFKTVKFEGKYLSGKFVGNVDEAFKCHQSINPGDVNSAAQVKKGDVVFVKKDTNALKENGQYAFEYYSRSTSLLIVAGVILAVLLLIFALGGFYDFLILLLSVTVGFELVITGFATGDFAIVPLVLILLLIIGIYAIKNFGVSVKALISAIGSVITLGGCLAIFNAIYNSFNITGVFDNFTLSKNSNLLEDGFSYKTLFICMILFAVIGGVVYISNKAVRIFDKTYTDFEQNSGSVGTLKLVVKNIKTVSKSTLFILSAVLFSYLAGSIPTVLQTLSVTNSAELYINGEQFTVVVLGAMFISLCIALTPIVVMALLIALKKIDFKKPKAVEE